jgi:hypothetical protein
LTGVISSKEITKLTCNSTRGGRPKYEWGEIKEIRALTVSTFESLRRRCSKEVEQNIGNAVDDKVFALFQAQLLEKPERGKIEIPYISGGATKGKDFVTKLTVCAAR